MTFPVATRNERKREREREINFEDVQKRIGNAGEDFTDLEELKSLKKHSLHRVLPMRQKMN